MKKCKFCQTEIDDKAKICLNCKKKQNKTNLIVVGVVIVIIILFASSGDSVKFGIQDGISDSLKTDENNKYLTELEWSLPKTLKVVVEIDSYDGDILQAGTYIFKETNSLEDREKDERIYNIYISKTNYSSESEISFVDWQFGLGGVQYENTQEFTVEKGDYIYISPVAETDKSIGHFKMIKK